MFDAIFCANMLHLATKGVLITYGPYPEDGVPTSPGNLSFDQSLRALNPAWGIRKREDVEQEARLAGLHLLDAAHDALQQPFAGVGQGLRCNRTQLARGGASRTRCLPECLAGYMAWSAAEVSVFSVSPHSG